MSRRLVSYLGLFAAVALTSGCLTMSTSTETVPQKELVNTDFVGEHSVQYLLQDAGTKTVAKNTGEEEEETETETIQYYHLYVEICDIGANDEENNCKSSKVLDRITRYGTYEYRRQVTDMFWNSSDTLFVSYLSPDPSVKSCTVTDSNTLKCADQSGINQILNKKKVFKTNVSTK
jgi:hypothetical protein